MQIEKPTNSNYCATVVSIKNIIPLENCDNVQATTIFGFQAIVGKGVNIGDIGIVFPVETQLSDDYCANNNLYRHNDKNIDKAEKGYIEDSRRVKAQKFRGHVSNCLFMPLTSLTWALRNASQILTVGDEFDTINGKEICRKYVVAVREGRANKLSGQAKASRVDKKHMPEHFDTDNFFKWSESLDQAAQVVVTQKLHGTSIRVGHTIVNRKLPIHEKFLSWFGVNIQKTEYDYVYASRKVIKDANNPDHQHYYDSDIWTENGKQLDGILPANYIVYAELIGWTSDGKQIQKNYTYGIAPNQSELYIYRIAVVNKDGHLTDLSWEQIKEFCKNNSLKHVPELWKGTLAELQPIVKEFLDTRYFDDSNYRNAISLGDNKDLVDEGICVRLERLTPYIMKAKSPKFLEHESSILDTGTEDLESSQNV